MRTRASAFLLFAPPLAMYLWAAAFYGAERDGGYGPWSWRYAVLVGFALLQLAITGWVVFLHRRAPFLMIALSVVMALWTFGALFVGGMAIADDWV